MANIKKRLADIYINREKLCSWLICAVVIGGILCLTGNLFCGWHRIDDHETFQIIKLYKQGGVSFSDAASFWIKEDWKIRWRPLYWFFRVLLPYLFGNVVILYKLLLCSVGIATGRMLYASARNLKCSIKASWVFVALIILGRQFEVWCRISNQENLGIFFFAICLYLLTKQYKERVFGWKIDFCILFFAFCSALMKESFLLLLPGIAWLRVGFEFVGRLYRPKDIWKVLRSNGLFIILDLVFFSLNIYVITAYVGVNQIGYAGLDKNYGIKDYIWAMMRMCKESLSLYFWLACILLAVVIVYCIKGLLTWKKTKTAAWNLFKAGDENIYLVLLLFGLYVIGTQMILYAKSGMWDRYLLPAIAGFALIFVVCLDHWIQDRRFRVIWLAVLSLFILGRGWSSVYKVSSRYAAEARAINKVYDVILDSTEEDDKIVSFFRNTESDTSFSIFMELQGRPQVYCCQEEDIATAIDLYGEHAGEETAIKDAAVFVTWAEGEEETDDMLSEFGTWEKIPVSSLYNVYQKIE